MTEHNDTAKLEKLLGRVSREELEKFVLEQGRKNEEFGYQLRSWLKAGFTLPEEKNEAYYQDATREAYERTFELCRRQHRRGRKAEEPVFPMPDLLAQILSTMARDMAHLINESKFHKNRRVSAKYIENIMGRILDWLDADSVAALDLTRHLSPTPVDAENKK